MVSGIELVTAITFGFDLGLNIYIAEHKMETILGYEYDIYNILNTIFFIFLLLYIYILIDLMQSWTLLQ